MNESTLARLRDQQLDANERDLVFDHLDECPDCRHRALRFTMDEQARTTGIVHRSSAETLVASEPKVPSGPALWAGESVDHFEVKLMLGRGAMGEVYLAKDTKLGRKVALKLMRPEMFDSRQAISRFQHEARAMARINHPNVVTIHAVGEHAGVPYVAMEFVRGESLYERLDIGGIDTEEAVAITLGIAGALRQAHELGVVHRDLKPENVIAARDGDVRVLDFGLAKMLDIQLEDSFAPTPDPADGDDLATRVGARVGTPLYMSPEQWRCEAITDATDMWALGVMFHEMLSGTVPFKGADLADLARKVCNKDAPVPISATIEDPLRATVTACLQRDPALRPSANEVIAALRKWQAAQTLKMAPQPPEPVPWPKAPPAAPKRAPLVLAALALLAGGVALGLLVGGGDSKPAEPASNAVVEIPAPASEAHSEPTASEAAAVPTASASADATAAAPSAKPAKRPARRGKRRSKDPFSKPPSNAGY